MDDAEIRALLESLASDEAPPSRINVGLARIRAHRRLRRRRAVECGAAAVAIAAIAIPVGIGAASHAPRPTAQHRPSGGPTVYVAYDDPGTARGGTVVPISTATNRAGKPIYVGSGRFHMGEFVAITPDGKTAYVVNTDLNTVIPISTATNRPGQPIKAGPEPTWIAITPDGKTAYVADQVSDGTVVPVSTATNKPGKPIHVGPDPFQIVITPDGKMAYVLGRAKSGHSIGKVTPISTATNTSGKPIYLPWIRDHGSAGVSIAMTPDGTTAYVSTIFPRTVVPISTATNTAGKPIAVNAPSSPVGGQIVIAPDGKTVYVVSSLSGTVVPISTATNTAGRPIGVGSGCRPAARLGAVSAPRIAITPDGKTVYVACQDSVVPISTATDTPGKPIAVPPGYPAGITITP